MNKLFFLAIVFLTFHTLTAQDSIIENKIVLGGSLNFFVQNNTYPISSLSIRSGIGGIFSNSTNETKNSTFAISPYIGKELNPRLILGVQLVYQRGNYSAKDIVLFGQSNTVDFNRTSNQIGFGFFTRHIMNPDRQFNFFIQPYIRYNLLNENESQDSNVIQEEKVSFIEAGVGAGLLYNINKKLRATLRIGNINYINGKWEIKDSDTKKDFSSFGTNINLNSISFGFELKL